MEESTLPTELIFHILCFSDPRDVIQWRTVSKVFYAITHETALWKTLHRTVPFPCTPGPFSTQSGSSIERTLLRAARLAESWTTRPMRVLSRLRVKNDPGDVALGFISGRWLLVLECDKRFVLHDVDPATKKHTQKVIWELETPVLFCWEVQSIISSGGYCIVYVLLSLSHPSPEWKLLEFGLNYDTGELTRLAVIDLPFVWTDSVLTKLCAGNSQSLFILVGGDKLVLDTRTRVFHKVQLPQEAQSFYALLDWIMLSDTTLVSLSRSDHSTIVYVFTLLPDGVSGETVPHTFRLTHRGVIHCHVVDVKVMKPAVDPTTGAMKIRLLDHFTRRNLIQLVYVEMTLPKHSVGMVLSIDVESRCHDISVAEERARLTHCTRHSQYIDISDDGQIRGFYRAKQGRGRSERPSDDPENQLIMKFNIDTRQEPWGITRSQIAEWNNEEDPLDRMGQGIVFDGMRGRLYYPHWSAAFGFVVVDIE